jgi:hypothetical protein
MNSQTEIHRAISDFDDGRFGRMPDSMAEEA